MKCVRVIVDNFERLPTHDATGGTNVACSKDDGGAAVTETGVGADPSGGEGGLELQATGRSNGPGDDGAKRESTADGGPAGGEGKLAEEGEQGQGLLEQQQQQQQQQQLKPREPKAIPANFLQAISAGLSTSLDPKVIKLLIGL